MTRDDGTDLTPLLCLVAVAVGVALIVGSARGRNERPAPVVTGNLIMGSPAPGDPVTLKGGH